MNSYACAARLTMRRIAIKQTLDSDQTSSLSGNSKASAIIRNPVPEMPLSCASVRRRMAAVVVVVTQLVTQAGRAHGSGGCRVRGTHQLHRPSIRAAGVRNDIDENVALRAFSAWRVEWMGRAEIPSDIRRLDVLLVDLAE
jgi:hypothetical protein